MTAGQGWSHEETSLNERARDDRSHRALLAHLRHELRTPLNAIIGYSEMLLEDVQDEGLEDLISDLQRVHAAGNQLLILVNEILDPDQLEAGLARLDLEAFGATLRHELRTPLNAVIGYIEMLVEDAQDQGDEAIVSDLQRIHHAGQRFLALIDDVVRFSAAQTAEADAGLEALAPAQDASAMVKHVVRSIRSLAQDAAAREAGQPGSILVVDDNETNRDLLAHHLERQGHAVTLAQDGRQALEMVGAHPYDLVLLDIMMPEVNGYEVLQRLKGNPDWRDIPVIMISGLDAWTAGCVASRWGPRTIYPSPSTRCCCGPGPRPAWRKSYSATKRSSTCATQPWWPTPRPTSRHRPLTRRISPESPPARMNWAAWRASFSA
jgi:adenylate cyclase